MKFPVEFMGQNNGSILFTNGQDAEVLTPDKNELIETLFSKIEEDFPEAFAALADIYQASERNLSWFKYTMVTRFIKCNFGRYDIHEYDMEVDGKLNLELVDCPLRGECKYENVICMPKKKNSLSTREMEIVALSATGKTCIEIADELCISVWTVNAHIKNILGKLKSHSIKQAITWYNENKDSFK